MNTLELRFRGPHERLPAMHQPSKNLMNPWVSILGTPGPHLGPAPPPFPPPHHPPLHRHHHHQQQQQQHCFPHSTAYQVHIPQPPMLQHQAHPPHIYHPHLGPQPPMHQLPPHRPRPPPLSHPSVLHFHHPPNPPKPSQFSPAQLQLLAAVPVHPPLPSAPYPYSSAAQSILPASTHNVALETKLSQGLHIPPPSRQGQSTVKAETEASSLSQSPHRCFTELPRFERPQQADVTKELKKEKILIRNFPSAFACDVLDDSDDERDGKQSNYLFHPGTIDFTYRPPPARDPFANSKSLRHQQPANPRRRRDNDDEGENDEDDTDLEDENDEDFVVREEKAYREILPKVSKLLSEVDMDETWQTDKEEKTCMICPFPQRLKGWTALLQHAEKFKKRRPVQHRAFYRALSEHLKRGPPRVDDESSEEKAVLIDSGKLAEEIIVWPPLVIVTNLKDDQNLDMYVPSIANMEVEKTLRERIDGKAGRMLVTFPATEIGLLNAKLLVENFVKLTPSLKQQNSYVSTNPAYNFRVAPGQIRRKCSSVSESLPPSWSIYHPQVPTARLAEPADMINVDPHKKLITWSAQNRRDILKRLSKKSKEEHEREKAKVKAKLVEVDQIAESHQKFKSSKALLSQQLKDAELALQEQKCLEEYISCKHAEELRMMDVQFKNDMWRFENERISREGKIRALLDWNEKQLVKERSERSKEVQVMKFHFASITQELERQKAQKALEKEREIARKREKIFSFMKQREAQFNEEARETERNLLERHEAQKMKLVEDFHKMRQAILMEWLEKQAALKASAENAKHEKEILEKEAEKMSMEMVKECSVCFMEFDEKTKRALIQPCGHAKVCIDCAVDIYQRTRLCPICREKILAKPKIMPKLFM